MKRNQLLFAGMLLLTTAGSALAQSAQLFKDLTPGAVTSNPHNFYNVGNHMYFIAKVGPQNVHQLWKSDGTPANTVMIKDSIIETNYGDVINFRGAVGDTVYFTKSNSPSTSTGKTEIWKSDGTTAGTFCYDTLSHQSGSGGGGAPRNWVVMGNKLYFSMGATNGRELWVTDGTKAGTYEVINLAPGTTGGGMQMPGLVDQPMIVYNNKVYFQGSTAPANYELFSSDGTAGGTTLVAEIMPGTTTSFGSYPEHFIVYNNELYFTADDGTGIGLWKTDGTNTTKVIQNNFGGSQPVIFKNELFYIDGIALWKTDGTTAGTVMVKDSMVHTITGANSNYLFTVYHKPGDSQYWRTDGTTSTRVGYDLGNSNSFKLINDKMYKSRPDSGSFTSYGIWESDGTAAGTSKIENFGPAIHIFKNMLFFANFEAATYVELWYIDLSGGVVTSDDKVAIRPAQINLYPNPTQGNVTIDTDSAVQNVSAFDITGKEVNIDFQPGARQLDLNHLNPGIYILQVQTDQGLSVLKLIKN